MFGVVALRADDVTKPGGHQRRFGRSSKPPCADSHLCDRTRCHSRCIERIGRRNGPCALETRVVPKAATTAAVAAAARDTVIVLIPSQGENIEKAYSEALAEVSDLGARASGLAI